MTVESLVIAGVDGDVGECRGEGGRQGDGGRGEVHGT